MEQRELLSAVTIQLSASRDTTIYDVPVGDIANGAGQFLIAGGSEGEAAARRSLILFDVSSAGIPAGATIIDAVVTMNLAQTLGGTATVSLHRTLNGWGAAGSDAPGSEIEGVAARPFDATWLYSFFNGSAWSTPGGDFSEGASATTGVSNLGAYEWLGGNVVDDVQDWLDNPVTNHGWMIIGNETSGNIKAFDSSDSSNTALRPTLEITYEEPLLPGVVEGRKWHDRNADGERVSSEVAALQLYSFLGQNYFNQYGGEEYWFRSAANNAWYFLLPSGELKRWNNAPHQLTGTVAAQLGHAAYQTATLLPERSQGEAEPYLNGFEFELINQAGSVVATDVSHDIDLNEDGIIDEETERGWFRFEGLLPGNYTVREVERDGWKQSASRTSPLAAEAYALDQNRGFYVSRTLYENDGGLGERWLRADDGWYYLTPAGHLFKWDGRQYSESRPLRGSLITTLDPAYYRNPALLHAAEDPTISLTSSTLLQYVEFGNYQPATISGRKWHDINPDGVRFATPEGAEFLFLEHQQISGTPGDTIWYSETISLVQYGFDSTGRVYVLDSANKAVQISFVSEAVSGSAETIAAAFLNSEPWLNGWTFELVDENGFVVDTQVTRDIDFNGDGNTNVESERGWYVFDDLLPGNYTVREVQQDGWIQTNPLPQGADAAIKSLTFQTPTRDFFNFGGRNERWIRTTNIRWHYITPDGSLYEWDRNSGGTHGLVRGTLVAKLSTSYYLNLSLFTNPGGSAVVAEDGKVTDLLNFGNHRVIDGLFSDFDDDLLA